ncbi:replication protein RepA [Salmonella enterica subsp. diarizonae]|nr:replication protein RepA [Salmonella enterica subsp. diarizonae]
MNAPLIFLAAKPWKIIGVFTFLAPVKPLTVMSQSPATLRRGTP